MQSNRSPSSITSTDAVPGQWAPWKLDALTQERWRRSGFRDFAYFNMREMQTLVDKALTEDWGPRDSKRYSGLDM